jgi:hypothetical protein
MVGHSGPLYRLPWLALAGLLVPVSVHGQGRWVVDSKSSLAWWQMSPNLNHLWATTCPADRNWRPGESRSSGWHINPRIKLPTYGYGNVEDTVHVPLFPRDTVRPFCVQAVRGEVVVADSVHWTGVHGMVAVESDALITGEAMRDVMMHQALESAQYPEIQFTLDSLVGVTKQGDTLRGSAVGTFLLREMPRPIVAAVQVFPDAGGLRVLAKWHIPATDLKELTPMIHRLGLGVNTQLWKTFFMGADIVFRHAAAREQ